MTVGHDRAIAAKRRQHLAAGVSPQGTGSLKLSREAATAMRTTRYSRLCCRRYRGFPFEMYPDDYLCHFYPPQILNQMTQHLAHAKQLAQTDESHARINLVEAEFRYLHSVASVHHIFRAYHIAPANCSSMLSTSRSPTTIRPGTPSIPTAKPSTPVATANSAPRSAPAGPRIARCRKSPARRLIGISRSSAKAANSHAPSSPLASAGASR